MQARIKATHRRQQVSNTNYVFNIYFEDLLISQCSSSILPQPVEPEEELIVEVLGEKLIYDLEDIVDSGTSVLQSTIGYETSSCGPITYKILNFNSLAKFDPSNNRRLII